MKKRTSEIFKNPGFIIKIESNGYGKNYQFDDYIDIKPGEIYLLSYIDEYRLVQITEDYFYKEIIREKEGNKIYKIIKVDDINDS